MNKREFLQQLIFNSPCRVEICSTKKCKHSCYNVGCYENKIIYLRIDENDTALLANYIHELAHFYLGKNKKHYSSIFRGKLYTQKEEEDICNLIATLFLMKHHYWAFDEYITHLKLLYRFYSAKVNIVQDFIVKDILSVIMNKVVK